MNIQHAAAGAGGAALKYKYANTLQPAACSLQYDAQQPPSEGTLEIENMLPSVLPIS